MEDIQGYILSKMSSLKDDLFKKVTSTVLGRDFVTEDAGRFEIRIIEGQPDKEYLAFDGNIIGHIKMFYGDMLDDYNVNQVRMGWEFVPTAENTSAVKLLSTLT